MRARDLIEPGALFRGALFADLVRADEVDVPAGTRFGVFRVVREIGRGGMGAVYLAERDDGQFAQQVALKVVACPNSELGNELFRRERQILAELRHPHIARLLDGGRLDDGMQWFAMELIDGHPVDVHCRSQSLPLDARLRLFLDVVDAVQFAHGRLLIHRDIKPGNVLVDVDGRAKLLDFGIATLVGEAATKAWSPGWASPEQRRGDPLGPASDQYQLGLLLRRVLAGDRAPAAPEPASGDAAGTPSKEPGWLSMPSWTRRELNAIVQRACADDPQRRYGSVVELGRDIRQLLDRRPVAAVGGGGGYQAWCLARRQPGLSLATLLVAIAFISLIVAFNLRLAQERDLAQAEAERARRAQAQADAEARRLRAISGFLNEDVLGAANPVRRPLGAPPLTVAAALESAEAGVATRFAEQPDMALETLYTIGSIYRVFGWQERSIATLGTALAQAERMPGPTPTSVRARAELGAAWIERQNFADATSALTLALEESTDVDAIAGVERLHWRFWLLDARSRQGAAAEVMDDYRALARDAEAQIGAVNTISGLSLLRVARQPRARGLPGSMPAESLQALAILQATAGVHDGDTLQAQVEYGLSRCNAGAVELCLALLREALRVQVMRFGEQPLNSMNFRADLGYALMRVGRPAPAIDVLGEVVRLRETSLGPNSPQLMTALVTLSQAQSAAGRQAGAQQSVDRALAIAKANPALPPALRVNVLRAKVDALLAAGRWREADDWLAQGEDIATALPESDLRRLALSGSRARWLIASGERQAGTQLLDRTVAQLRTQLPDDHPLLAPLLQALSGNR
jgi:serine/threonine-protein kinase